MPKSKKIPVSEIREKLKITLGTKDKFIEAQSWGFVTWWLDTQSTVSGLNVFALGRKKPKDQKKLPLGKLTPSVDVVITYLH